MSFKCNGCPDRRVGCHSSCESHLSERAKLNDINDRKFKELQTQVGISEANYRGIRRALRKRGKKC